MVPARTIYTINALWISCNGEVEMINLYCYEESWPFQGKVLLLPATALFRWCRHKIYIQSMNGAERNLKLAYSQLQASKPAANITLITANHLLANLSLSLLQNKSVISWRHTPLAAQLDRGCAQKVEGKGKGNCFWLLPHFCQNLVFDILCSARLIHPCWLSKEFSAPRANLP